MPTTGYMTSLGWGVGPGIPGSSYEDNWKRRNLRRATAVKSVRTLWLNRRAVVQFNALNLYLQHTGARLGATMDDWGYANRPIRGASATTFSYHRWGLAEDLDATEHPLGVRSTTFARTRADRERIRRVCKLLGLRWGYDYRTRPDPMHFEVVVSRLRARYIRSRLVKPTKRSRELAALCDMSVARFCARVRRSEPYPG